jgi:hypothetical protein
LSSFKSWSNYTMALNILKLLWKIFCVVTHFILWKSILSINRNNMFVPWWDDVRIVCKCILCSFVTAEYLCVLCFYILFAFFNYKHICTAFIHTYCMTFSTSFELYSLWIYGNKVDSDGDMMLHNFSRWYSIVHIQIHD